MPDLYLQTFTAANFERINQTWISTVLSSLARFLFTLTKRAQRESERPRHGVINGNALLIRDAIPRIVRGNNRGVTMNDDHERTNNRAT